VVVYEREHDDPAAGLMSEDVEGGPPGPLAQEHRQASDGRDADMRELHGVRGAHAATEGRCARAADPKSRA
jgi:hypothetical protein